jgi:multiple sugar transport system substrate-binding protein
LSDKLQETNKGGNENMRRFQSTGGKGMKKILSAILVGAMTMTMLAGCGSSGNTEDTGDTAASTETTETQTDDTQTTQAQDTAESTTGDTTLTFWTVFTGSDGDILREIVNDYNETNTDGITVEVDIMDNSTLQSKLPSAIASGTGPDFVLVGIEYMQEYVQNDMLESIDDFWDATGTNKENYYENVVNKSYVNGTLYGVPMQYNLQYLYYNKDLFEKAGITSAPATLDELAEDARKLTDKDNGQYGLACPSDFGYYVQYLWGNGGDVINTETGENLLYTDANIDTLTWLQQLAADVSPDGLTSADADTMFQSGQLAMCIAGPWNINVLNELGLNYGIAAMPAGSDGAYSAEGGCSYMIPKGTSEEVKNAVYKFMEYWVSDAVLKEWSMRNGFPVWSYSLLEDSDIQSNEVLSSVSEASSIGRDWHLGYEYGSQIDADVMTPMMENILLGGDVQTELEAASERLDGIIK